MDIDQSIVIFCTLPSTMEDDLLLPVSEKAARLADRKAYDAFGGVYGGRNSHFSQKLVRPYYTNGLVRVGPSTVCDGIGIFAERFLPKNSIVTAYAGKRWTDDTSELTQEDRECLKVSEYGFSCLDGSSIDGSLCGDENWWSREGVAHLANDALDHSPSGHKNCCSFLQLEVSSDDDVSDEGTEMITRVFLATERDISPGEELLVSYGMEYWMYRAAHLNKSGCHLSELTASWLTCHLRVQNEILRKHLGENCCIHEYSGVDISTTQVSHEGVMRYIVTDSNAEVEGCRCTFSGKKSTTDEKNITRRIHLHMNRSRVEDVCANAHGEEIYIRVDVTGVCGACANKLFCTSILTDGGEDDQSYVTEHKKRRRTLTM